jgi:hypothetical protein
MDDSVYQRAWDLLRTNLRLAKKRFADMSGVRTSTFRRLIHRCCGETERRNDDNSAYPRVRRRKAEDPDCGAPRIAKELGITIDHATLHLARLRGVTQTCTPPAPTEEATASPKMKTPAKGAQLRNASTGYGEKLAAEAYYWHEQDSCVATFIHFPA